MASTSFHEQPGMASRPTGGNSAVTPSAQTMQMMAAAAAAAKSNPDTAAVMLYYQTLAEKCWGLNSPPGSDTSSTSSSKTQGKNILYILATR